MSIPSALFNNSGTKRSKTETAGIYLEGRTSFSTTVAFLWFWLWYRCHYLLSCLLIYLIVDIHTGFVWFSCYWPLCTFANYIYFVKVCMCIDISPADPAGQAGASRPSSKLRPWSDHQHCRPTQLPLWRCLWKTLAWQWCVGRTSNWKITVETGIFMKFMWVYKWLDTLVVSDCWLLSNCWVLRINVTDLGSCLSVYFIACVMR